MAEYELETDARHDLERGERRPGLLQSAGEEGGRGLERAQARHAGDPLDRLGEKPQHRGGDDAERSLRADDEVLEIITRIVLAQRLQAVPHAPVGEHDFKPKGEIARAAVSEHGHAAGIGGEHAADLAASFRGEAQREQAPRARRHLLSLRKHEPRFDRHGV